MEIKVNGDDALAGAKIISAIGANRASQIKNTQLKMYISGINNNSNSNFSIYCNETNTCKIDCETQRACSMIYLYCHDNCYVKCDEEGGIDCPIYGNFSEWKTNNGNGGLGDGAIIGLIVAGVVLLICIVLVVLVKVVFPKQREHKSITGASSGTQGRQRGQTRSEKGASYGTLDGSVGSASDDHEHGAADKPG